MVLTLRLKLFRLVLVQIKHCTEQVQILNTDLKEQLQLSKERLYVAHSALRNVTNEKQLLQKKNSVSQKKLNKCKEVESILILNCMNKTLTCQKQFLLWKVNSVAVVMKLMQICILVMRTLHFKLNIIFSCYSKTILYAVISSGSNFKNF